MNANGPVQPGVPPRAAGGGAPAPSPDDTLAALVRDRAVVVAALFDAGSGMLLTSRSRDGAPEDLDTVCAGQADVIRAALDAARVSIGGPAPTEVVVAHGDRLHQVLRTVHDPLGDRLVLSLLVDGPPRALRRVRRRLGRIDAAALVPLPHRGAPPAPPQAPVRAGGDLFTPAHPGAQGPWWAGDGVPPEPPAAPWAGPPPGAAVGFSADVVDSAIEETVRLAARTPATGNEPVSGTSPVPPPAAAGSALPPAAAGSALPPAAAGSALPPAAAADPQAGPAAEPATDPDPVTTALPVVADRPAAAGPHTVTVSLGSNPAALPARPAAAPTATTPPAAPQPATSPQASAAQPATPAVPVAMLAVPAAPPAPAVPVAPVPIGSVPAALPARTTAAPVAPRDGRVPDGRSAGWSTASVLGLGVGPGGAPTATDLVAALDRAGTDDSLSGDALFTGVVPAEPPRRVDDLPAPLAWDAEPAPNPAQPGSAQPGPAQPGPGPAGAATGGAQPHPWFGGGRHSRRGGPAPTTTAQPGPGRHTTTGTPTGRPTSPGAPTSAAAQPPAERPRPVPRPREAEADTSVDRVVAAAIQGARNGTASSSGWSLFEPAPRAETDVSAVAGRQDSTPVGLGVPGARTAPDDAAPRETPPGSGPADTGRDGGNRVDPGR
ncbi:MAG: hypothetical protein ABS81_18345 [Pseudonocardia sp. SCN 72-86]|nr:MAG: hypothetical protein ABS81_18345 [Pseudonocardia sp. SCN 72-86]